MFLQVRLTVTSHLKKPIKHFYEETDDPYAVIMEDDCDINIARYWTFTFRQFMSRVPYDWDVVQLAIICPGELHVNIHRRFINDFSTACYVITRHHAKKLIDLHCRGDMYRLDNGVSLRPVADDLIYNSGASYACPILLYKIELGSSIHPEHIEIFHSSSHNGLRELWETRGSDMTLDMITNFDPYNGRIAGQELEEKHRKQLNRYSPVKIRFLFQKVFAKKNYHFLVCRVDRYVFLIGCISYL